MFTSIAIARVLGPTKMTYIIYVSWIASVVSGLGGLGIPTTTRKCLAEFLAVSILFWAFGNGDPLFESRHGSNGPRLFP